MTKKEFLRTYREEIDNYIWDKIGFEHRNDDQERWDWLLNDEVLYRWLLSELSPRSKKMLELE